MGTVSDKLVFLGQTKADIRTAIQNKGVLVPAETTFRNYATKIDDIILGHPEAYVRHHDWLEIRSIADGYNDIFIGLVFIQDVPLNVATIRAYGNYTVDWGDGVTENYNSGVLSEHNYNYANHVGTESDRGYRQAIIKVTPNGSTFTNVGVTTKGPSYIALTGILLDVVMKGVNVNSHIMGGQGGILYHRFLECFEFIGTNKVTNCESWFMNLSGLIKCTLGVSTAVGGYTYFRQMFYYNVSLRELNLVDTINVTNFENAFNSCYSLYNFPAFNFKKATAMASAFQNANIKELTLNIDANAAMTQAFYGCKVKKLTINAPLVLNLVTTFSLATINELILNVGKVTSTGKCFKQTNINTIPAIDLMNHGAFDGETILYSTAQKVLLYNIKNTFSVNGMALGKDALVTLFNNLMTVTVATNITITGTLGASLLTVDDRLIATNKGWTIVG